MAERRKLGELLIEAGVLNATQLQSAMAHQRQWGVRLGTALLEKGFVDEETLGKFLSVQRNMPHVTLSKLKIPPEVLKRIPRELQERHLAVPVTVVKEGNRESLVVAMADPTDLQALDDIKFAIGAAKIKPVLAVEAAVKKVLFGDNRAFRPGVNRAPAEAPAGELTDEFQIVRGTMEQTAAGAPPPMMTGNLGQERTITDGVDAPVGEAMIDLDMEEVVDIGTPLPLEPEALEPIAPGTMPGAAPAPAARAPVGGDPLLDALRGPPRGGGAAAAVAAAPAPMPAAPPRPTPMPAPAPAAPPRPTPMPVPAAPPHVSAPLVPAAAAPARPMPAAAPATIPGVMPSPFSSAGAEDKTEIDLPAASLGGALPPIPEESPFGAEPPLADAAASDPNDTWSALAPEGSPFEPVADAAPWPPAESPADASLADAMETQPGGLPPEGESADLGPGAVPVVASGASPLEASVPEISLPGPEVAPGAQPVGAFDPDTAPETDLGPAGDGASFAIPSELEVQEGSFSGAPMPQDDGVAEGDAGAHGEASGMESDAFAPDTQSSALGDAAETGFEPTAADEPMPGGADGEPPAPDAFPGDAAADDAFSVAETSVSIDPEADGPPSNEAPAAADAPVSSSAGAVPVMTSLEAQGDVAERTAIGAGHAEPTWDAPMELSAPPEGSVVGDTEIAPPSLPVENLGAPKSAPRVVVEVETDRVSVTRESPFPPGAEPSREPARLSPSHVQPDPAPAAAAASASAPAPAPAPREVTPPTQQSGSVGPPPAAQGDIAVGPRSASLPAAASTSPPAGSANTRPANEDASASGPGVSAPAISEEQAALNLLVTKKLKLLNAIAELLLEKGLITEDEIKATISKKKS